MEEGQVLLIGVDLIAFLRTLFGEKTGLIEPKKLGYELIELCFYFIA